MRIEKNKGEYMNPITPSIHRTVKDTLKILQQVLQDFLAVFAQFVDIWYYRVNISADNAEDLIMKPKYLVIVDIF